MHLQILLPSLLPRLLLFLPTAVMSLAPNPQAALGPTKNRAASATTLPVRGDSPAYYNGDPAKDILFIETLDLVPNPPTDHMTLRLKGTITAPIGPNPHIQVTVSLNGTVGPRIEDRLCSNGKLEIKQNGTSTGSCPPEEGAVEMVYSAMIPYIWLKMGNYTVRTEMYATDGGKMTDFEGTAWVAGELGGGDGW